MLNAEKHRKEILNNYSKGFSIIDGHIDDCESIACKSCLFSNSKNDDGYSTCINRKVKWLLSEYNEHVELSKLEYDILKWIKENTLYKYLIRNEYGILYVTSEKPFKDDQYHIWTYREDSYERLSIFNRLFEFVDSEDEEPQSIEKLLQNCEVVDDE